MPRVPNFSPKKTPAGWMVSVPPALTATGKRVRRFFTAHQKAEEYAGKIRRAWLSGQSKAVITAELALQAAAAQKILEPMGLSLIEAARIVQAQKASSSDMEAFRSKWKRVMIHGESFWSDRYRKDMEKIPRWVGAELMAKPCGMLTDDALVAALRANGAESPSTIRMRKMRVKAVLQWKDDKPTKKRRVIQILSPAQVGKVLRACITPEERRTVALLVFAGIRPDADDGEIARLDWAAVGESEIYVCPETSKVGDRHIPITPRLRRMLRGHPSSGPVRPVRWKLSWMRIRRIAGISEMQDVLRHTFASNFLAAFGEDATKQAMGHTKGSDTLFRHYRRAVTTAAGLKFFGLNPENPAAL